MGTEMDSFGWQPCIVAAAIEGPALGSAEDGAFQDAAASGAG